MNMWASAPQSPGSFHAYMQQHLFGHVDMEAGRADIPDGMADNVAAEAARYEAQIAAAGGIDLLLLGIGANGHIGFNEPGSDFASRTREVRLDEATRIANAINFSDRASVPERAITMGIATILEARSILLVATGTGEGRRNRRRARGSDLRSVSCLGTPPARQRHYPLR